MRAVQQNKGADREPYWCHPSLSHTLVTVEADWTLNQAEDIATDQAAVGICCTSIAEQRKALEAMTKPKQVRTTGSDTGACHLHDQTENDGPSVDPRCKLSAEGLGPGFGKTRHQLALKTFDHTSPDTKAKQGWAMGSHWVSAKSDWKRSRLRDFRGEQCKRSSEYRTTLAQNIMSRVLSTEHGGTKLSSQDMKKVHRH